jgi:hypothetical protein
MLLAFATQALQCLPAFPKVVQEALIVVQVVFSGLLIVYDHRDILLEALPRVAVGSPRLILEFLVNQSCQLSPAFLMEGKAHGKGVGD